MCLLTPHLQFIIIIAPSLLQVTSLNPNSMYIVIVRAANSEMQWGAWSEERTVLTLPLLNVTIDSIGENYITVGWGRDETVQAEMQTGVVVASTEWHVVVTSHDMNYEQNVDVEALAKTGGLYTVPQLKPDTKYLLTLRASYGNDEWGLWTNPVTFLTLNQLGLTVSNIGEDRADFLWGRGVQSTQHAYDPNMVIWKGLITKYVLQIQTVAPAGGAAAIEDTREVQVAAGGAGGGEKDGDVLLEREMEMNRFKYIQTYCTTNDLRVDTEYMVRIRAVDDRDRWGEWTELVFETPPLCPGKPILKKAHSNYIAFEWEPPDTMNRYLYCVEQAISKGERKKDERTGSAGESAVEWKVVETVTETCAKIKTATALTKCRFRIKCCKMDKAVHLWSKYSQVAYFTAATPPEAVSNLTITSLSKSSATLEWVRPGGGGSVGGVDARQVTFKVLLGEKDGAVQFIGTTKTCKYELTGLRPNTHYRTQVQVETENGLSAKNTILKFSTRADVGDVPQQPPHARRTSQPTAARPAHTAGGAAKPALAAGSDPQQSSESSDTLGNKVRLPVLSPPRASPGHLHSTQPVIAPGRPPGPSPRRQLHSTYPPQNDAGAPAAAVPHPPPTAKVGFQHAPPAQAGVKAPRPPPKGTQPKPQPGRVCSPPTHVLLLCPLISADATQPLPLCRKRS